MRTFEIPYMPINEEVNEKFIKFYSGYKEFVNCIYTPSYINDGTNTRTEFDNHIEDFNDYFELIDKVREHFPVEILIQKDCTKEIIQKYYNLGLKRFTINDDDLAKQLKKQYDDIILTLSITRLLSHEDMFNLDLSCYDYIVLDYRYCRQLSLLKELPKKYKYVLLINSRCDYKNRTFCKMHWFDSEKFNNNCKKLLRNSSLILPQDLKYFDDYVHHYKLQGRENFSPQSNYNFVRPNIFYYFSRNKNYYDLK